MFCRPHEAARHCRVASVCTLRHAQPDGTLFPRSGARCSHQTLFSRTCVPEPRTAVVCVWAVSGRVRAIAALLRKNSRVLTCQEHSCVYTSTGVRGHGVAEARQTTEHPPGIRSSTGKRVVCDRSDGNPGWAPRPQAVHTKTLSGLSRVTLLVFARSTRSPPCCPLFHLALTFCASPARGCNATAFQLQSCNMLYVNVLSAQQRRHTQSQRRAERRASRNVTARANHPCACLVHVHAEIVLEFHGKAFV